MSNIARQAAEEVLLSVIADILPALDCSLVTPDKNLADLGADSVERVEIIMTVRDLLGVEDSLATLGGLRNIGELIERLAGGSPS
ncbi:phosphopantetheine-binding protein [Streptomyces sp. NPDC001139]